MGDEGISSQPENDEAVSSFVVDRLREGLCVSRADFSCSSWRKSSSVKLFRSVHRCRFVVAI